MKIFKYRHTFAYGPGKWEYAEMNGYTKEQFVETLHNEYDWSEKYRGCDVEIVDAQKEYIEQALKDAENLLEYTKKRIEKLKEELKSYERQLR